MVVRFTIVCIIFLISLAVPNLNLLLTLSGAVLGTIINVYFPALFYLRAYNTSQKNQNLECGEDQEPTPQPRTCVKFWAYFMIIFGTFVGIWGLGYVVIVLANGTS